MRALPGVGGGSESMVVVRRSRGIGRAVTCGLHEESGNSHDIEAVFGTPDMET